MSHLIKWENQLHCTLGTRGFFFSRVRLDASVSARGRRLSLEGRSIFSHAAHNLKSCLKPKTAHEKSLSPTVKTL